MAESRRSDKTHGAERNAATILGRGTTGGGSSGSSGNGGKCSDTVGAIATWLEGPHSEGDMARGEGGAVATATRGNGSDGGGTLPSPPPRLNPSPSPRLQVLLYSQATRGVRCAFSDRNVHARMPLIPTQDRLKLLYACDQWHSSRVYTFLTSSNCKLRRNTVKDPIQASCTVKVVVAGKSNRFDSMSCSQSVGGTVRRIDNDHVR
jgi:hypothetical protein